MDFGRSGLLGLIVQRHVRVGLDTELGLVRTLHHSTMDINVMLMVRLIGKIRIVILESVVSIFLLNCNNDKNDFFVFLIVSNNLD